MYFWTVGMGLLMLALECSSRAERESRPNRSNPTQLRGGTQLLHARLGAAQSVQQPTHPLTRTRTDERCESILRLRRSGERGRDGLAEPLEHLTGRFSQAFGGRIGGHDRNASDLELGQHARKAPLEHVSRYEPAR